jgi:phosphate regulon transcriptional regulator PhoB
MPSKILVVDDEKDIVELISYNLGKEGFSVTKAYDGEGALDSVKKDRPDLIILDLMLPGMQGMEVTKRLRNNPETANLPIVMLTAKSGEVDTILGLEMGADDYVTKPFRVRELMARVRALLRRAGLKEKESEKETFSFKDLFIDFTSHVITVHGAPVDLSPTEFKLLHFFVRRPGRVYTRNQILDHVWGDDAFVEPRTVDVHIRRLRSQIETDILNPQLILTVRGVGYKFSDLS